jgi:catechol 2,3-dioxygenase-like lactoylglutathione lyase family enzyme
MPLHTERMDHVSLATPDLKPALAFYRDLLGFKEIRRPPLDFDGSWLEKDGLVIHLIVPKEGVERMIPAKKANPYLGHLAFRISDVEATRAALSGHGVDYIEQAGPPHQIWALDPAGNMVEFIRLPD